MAREALPRGRGQRMKRRRHDELAPSGAGATVDAPTGRPFARESRRHLAFRYRLRHAHGYFVDAPGGRVGHVAEVQVAPYEFWPEAFVVHAHDGQVLLVPVGAVSRVYAREQTLVLSEAPPGIGLIPYRERSWHERIGAWRFVDALAFVGSVGGYLAMLVLLAFEATLEAAPLLLVLGAIGALASASAWKAGRRTWPVRTGLVSAWVPLAVGVILSLVLVFG
jgi:hypothetical protein